jgi:hypothetical protein
MEFFNQINDEGNWNAMDNLFFDAPAYEYENCSDLINKISKIENVRSQNEITMELYIGTKCNENTAEHKGSDLNDSEHEIRSVDGEKKYNTKNISSDETESIPSKHSAASYESLFTLVEDKNMYSIGESDDSLCLSNNNEMKTLNVVLSNTDTDLNDFIGDLLKFCPSDNLVKKQRIYKAKNIKRKRKTKSQIRKLEKEFSITQNWDKEDFKRLSETLSLTRDQVYKWFWDQKNKKE